MTNRDAPTATKNPRDVHDDRTREALQAEADAFRTIAAASTAVQRLIDARAAAHAAERALATVSEIPPADRSLEHTIHIRGLPATIMEFEAITAQRDAAVDALARAEAEIQRLVRVDGLYADRIDELCAAAEAAAAVFDVYALQHDRRADTTHTYGEGPAAIEASRRKAEENRGHARALRRAIAAPLFDACLAMAIPPPVDPRPAPRLCETCGDPIEKGQRVTDDCRSHLPCPKHRRTATAAAVKAPILPVDTVSPATVLGAPGPYPIDTEGPSGEPAAYDVRDAVGRDVLETVKGPHVTMTFFGDPVAVAPMSGGTPATQEEPAPTGDGAPIWPLVITDVSARWPRAASANLRRDMAARDVEGTRKYGTPLRAHNGRRPLVDAYQESLDLAVYLRQAIEEGGQPADVPALYREALRICWVLESFANAEFFARTFALAEGPVVDDPPAYDVEAAIARLDPAVDVAADIPAEKIEACRTAWALRLAAVPHDADTASAIEGWIRRYADTQGLPRHVVRDVVEGRR